MQILISCALMTYFTIMFIKMLFDFRISCGFKVIECSRLEEFQRIFESTGLIDAYQHYIKHSS